MGKNFHGKGKRPKEKILNDRFHRQDVAIKQRWWAYNNFVGKCKRIRKQYIISYEDEAYFPEISETDKVIGSKKRRRARNRNQEW